MTTLEVILICVVVVVVVIAGIAIGILFNVLSALADGLWKR